MRLNTTFLILLLTAVSGCSDSVDPASQTVENAATADTSGISESDTSQSAAPVEPQPRNSGNASDDVTFEPLGLSALSGGSNSESSAAGTESGAQQVRDVIDQLKPLQVLLGKWRGTTRREYEGFKAVDSHEWVWDLQTDPTLPALRVRSDKSPYIRDARLSWDVAARQFILRMTDASGVTRTLTGQFTDPVHEEVGSDDKLHRVFRLQFTESSPPSDGGGEFWQVAISQQENNRYLLELDKRRGRADFRRYDTVSTQREGTSFALSDTDYGEKTCIISEGLGTTEIVYKGRSYWVCCSGCKAAFEEDPEKWIALAAERDQEKKEEGNAVP